MKHRDKTEKPRLVSSLRLEMNSVANAALSRTSGFTLLELLMVVGIIAILASLAVPILSSTTAARHKTVCLNNMRQIATAMLTYCNDNNGQFPPGINKGLAWNQTISPYMGLQSNSSNRIFTCPNDPRGYRLSNGTYAGFYARSYSLSGMPDDLNSWTGGYGLVHGSHPSRRLSAVTAPGQTIMLCENPVEPNLQHVSWSSFIVTGWTSGKWIPTLPNGAYIHGTLMNFAFVDGHVESMDPNLAYSGSVKENGYVSMWSAIR